MPLTVDAQLRYLVQWFEEWSELQRSDFVPVLAEKVANVPYVNGIVNSMSAVNYHDKPMSLFECRVKLFREWQQHWTADQRQILVQKICELDPIFAEKLADEIKNNVPITNGHAEELEDVNDN